MRWPIAQVVGLFSYQFKRTQRHEGRQSRTAVGADGVVLLEDVVTFVEQNAGKRMEAAGHALAQNHEVWLQPQRAILEYVGLPESGLDFVNAHQRTDATTPMLSQPQVVGFHGNRLAIHQNRFGPKTGHALAVLAKSLLQCVGIVGFNRDHLDGSR